MALFGRCRKRVLGWARTDRVETRSYPGTLLARWIVSVDLSEAKVPRTLEHELAHAAHCPSAVAGANDTARGSRIQSSRLTAVLRNSERHTAANITRRGDPPTMDLYWRNLFSVDVNVKEFYTKSAASSGLEATEISGSRCHLMLTPSEKPCELLPIG